MRKTVFRKALCYTACLTAHVLATSRHNFLGPSGIKPAGSQTLPNISIVSEVIELALAELSS